MPRSLVSTVQATTSFLKEAWFQGTPTWTTADIPDLSGQVFIVTGGNSGLGKDTVRALLEHEARVYVASRDEKRSLAAIDELFEQTGRRALFLQLDLADLKSVKMAADQFLSKETRLDVLYNNAGVLGTPLDVVANGYDMAFHTHILDQNARVVNLTSSAHHLVGSPPLEFDTFKDGPERRKREDLAFFYCQSKFATILFSNELSRRYKDQGIVSIAVNPGNFSTSLQRRMNESSVHSFLTEYCLFLYPGEWGSITQLWAGTAPEALEASGKYVAPWGRIGQPHPETEDVELAVKLWVYLEEQINDV